MPEDKSSYVLRSVGAAVDAVLDARDEVSRLKRIFERSPVPMVMVDDSRRYVEVNHSARLWFRLSLDEMRKFTIGDLTPSPNVGFMERAWAQLLDAGSNAGRYPAYAGDGSRLDLIYCGRASALPGMHLIAFAPADWTEHKLDPIEDDHPDASASLTPREIEVLTLAANGLSSPDVAQALGVSPSTVRTHFKNILPKLGVRNRAGAVAKAMRLGLID